MICLTSLSPPAQLETSLGQASLQEDSADDSKSASDPKSLTMAVTSQADISSRSVDWRLATPQMAKSLSQHLCDAFFESCCFVLPSFSYYRDRLPAYRNATNVAPSTKVAIAAFCAVGARASPHSVSVHASLIADDTHLCRSSTGPPRNQGLSRRRSRSSRSPSAQRRYSSTISLPRASRPSSFAVLRTRIDGRGQD